ncbi:MAG: hypothetical protein WBG02_15675 [Candidatus Acidiferrum sp.]
MISPAPFLFVTPSASDARIDIKKSARAAFVRLQKTNFSYPASRVEMQLKEEGKRKKREF